MTGADWVGVVTLCPNQLGLVTPPQAKGGKRYRGGMGFPCPPNSQLDEMGIVAAHLQPGIWRAGSRASLKVPPLGGGMQASV